MLAQFIKWYFLEIPCQIKKICSNYLWFFYKYFALGYLCQNLFTPWKGLVFHRQKRAFEIGDAFYAWFSNVFISRPIGAVIRLFFIIAGSLAEVTTLFIGFLVFIGWIIYIPAIFYFFIVGLRLLL